MGIFYNNDYNDYINEGVVGTITALTLAPFVASFGIAAALIACNAIENRFCKLTYISNSKIKQPQKYMSKGEKAALLNIAIIMVWEELWKNTIIISKDKENELNNKVYVYEFKNGKMISEKETTLRKLFNSNNINIKYYNEAILQQRKEAVDKVKKYIENSLNDDDFQIQYHNDNEFLKGTEDYFDIIIKIFDDEDTKFRNEMDNIMDLCIKKCELSKNFKLECVDGDGYNEYYSFSDSNTPD